MPSVDSNLPPLMGTNARCEKTLLGSNVVGMRMRYGQGLELIVSRKSGNLVEQRWESERSKEKRQEPKN